LPLLMEKSGCLLYQHEVVLYKASFYECTLIRRKRSFSFAANLLASIFVMSLANEWTKLIGLKSLISMASSFFGTRII
jgi:hypothetical protein